MPTYDYECRQCGLRFERRQAMSDPPLTECPECRGPVLRRISGGAGFIIKGTHPGPGRRPGGGCSREQGGPTCCGREERCGKPPCGEGS